MFTGIVTHRGLVEAAEDLAGGGRRLRLSPAPPLDAVRLGDSIAVDGVCLTVASIDGGTLGFDVVPETLRRSTIGLRRPGDRTNLERSLRVGDEMGGHVVQGHVEGTGVVAARTTVGEDVRLEVEVGPDLFGGLIPKGSVAVDGVSLTLGEVSAAPRGGGGRFSVYLVPHTLGVTGFGGLAPGDRVNVEPDVLGRWVEHHVRRILVRTDPREG